MLTEKEIKALPPGEYPNWRLRAIFGSRHGTVVKARYTPTGGGTEVEREFVGNRAQRRFRKRNPFKPLPVPTTYKPQYQEGKGTVSAKSIGWFSRLIRFIKKQFT